jgi:hypothetical protein
VPRPIDDRIREDDQIRLMQAEITAEINPRPGRSGQGDAMPARPILTGEGASVCHDAASLGGGRAVKPREVDPGFTLQRRRDREDGVPNT